MRFNTFLIILFLIVHNVNALSAQVTDTIIRKSDNSAERLTAILTVWSIPGM